MITNILFLLVGLGVGYFLYDILLRKNKGLYAIISSVKKKRMIAFLETDKSIYVKPIEKLYKNLGVTKQREVIILPKSSVKPCMGLGIPIAHGDLYKSVTTPQEVRQFVSERKKDGWKDEDIAQFFQEIETIPGNKLKNVYKQMKEGKDLDGNEIDVNKIEKMKFDIYNNMDSVVKDFIYTGLNRVSIHDMLREIIYQRELEKMGKRNWIMIAVAIMIIIIAIGLGVRFIFSTPGITNMVTSAISSTPRIAPQGD